MLDVHIDDFFSDVAVILLSGLQNFPAPQILFIEDICGPDDTDEFGLHSPRHLAALGAIQWLRDESYVRFGVIDRQESVDDFVLTSKSFSRLIKVLRDSGEPVFRELTAARTEGDSIRLRQLMTDSIINEL
jgi:hypothetical protein